MERRLSLAVVLFIVLAAPASADPTAYYDPGDGNLWIANDAGHTISAFILTSKASQLLTNTSLYAIPAGAIFSADDLPYAMTYLEFPATGAGLDQAFKVGKVVPPGTSASDLEYWYLLHGLDDSVRPLRTVVVAPEPASGALVIASLFALALPRRCSSRLRG